MSRVVIEEIQCKSALNRVQGALLPFKWTLNPYRGCQHACVYCFARATDEFLGYDAGRDFDTRIAVKVNLAGVRPVRAGRAPLWRDAERPSGAPGLCHARRDHHEIRAYSA